MRLRYYAAQHSFPEGGMANGQARMRAAAGAILLFTASVAAGGQSSTPAPAQPPLMATRLSTGTDGQTHIDEVPIALHGSGAAESDPLAMEDAFLVRAAPGYFEDWHNADKKRYIVVVSGEAEVTTTSGERTSIVPGHLYIAEDLTGKGHTFRVVGNQEWVALFVNFAP
jgi:quercetin dioxygenase-like cupin family protein